MQRTLIIAAIIIVIAFAWFYFGTKGVQMNSQLDNRATTALTVYDNPLYKTSKGEIPDTYYNEYYKKQMPLNICDFYWAASQKSYQPAGQSYDICSYEAIKQVLLKGARVVNLDIYSSDSENIYATDAKPVVRNDTIMPVKGVPLDFTSCLQTIQENAWIDNSDYPLIIYLGFHVKDNKFLYASVAEALKTVFGNAFIDKKYGFGGRNGMYPFGQIPIADIKGKVAIVSDTYPTAGSLDEYIHAVSSDTSELVKSIAYDNNYQSYGGIAGQHINTRSMITFNMKHITLITSQGTLAFENVYDPKSDLYNAPAQDCQKYGCQIVLMNYQLLDKNMEDYLDIFRKASLVLKPNDLRYIPKPPPPIKEQEQPLYYNPRTVTTPGWFKLNY